MNIEYKINYEQYSQENSADVIIVKGETYTFKSSGLTRRVFANSDKTKVIKVPVKLNTFHFNNEEVDCWNNADDETRLELASTKILENGYIEQEYLHTLDDDTTPNWLGRPMTQKEIRFATSCRDDVGYDNDGNLKCFDLHEYKQY